MKIYASNFIHHDFYNSEKNICGIRPFCRLLFCHSNVVLSSIVLSQQCCEVYFISLAEAKPL